MSAEVELKIHSLLSGGLSTEDAIVELASIDIDSLSPEDGSSLLLFLLNANAIKELSELAIRLLENDQDAHWGTLAHALDAHHLLNENDLLPSLNEAAEESHQQEQLLSSPAVTSASSRLLKEKQRLIKKSNTAYLERKEGLIEKINFFKYENLIDQEKSILKQLEIEYPETTDLKSMLEDFNKRWAHHLISNRQLKKHEEQLDTVEPLPEELQAIADLIYSEAEKICSKSPQYAYDFALMFYFFDDHRSAVKLLPFAHPSPALEWLQVELLLTTRRFVEALDLCKNLENKYNSIPDTQFASTFSSARALWGLGKKGKAIELMQSIVKIKPNYRSADSLLSKWKEGLL